MTPLIISSMKDEGPYLLEWLAHHRAVGFTQFLIYSNDCTDGTDHLLDRLDARGLVTHRRTKVLRRGPQKSALKHAFESGALDGADWVYVTDADEFLQVKVGEGRLSDLIAAYPDADVIPVTWRHFSTEGAVDLLSRPVSESVTDAEPEAPRDGEVGRFVKSLFRPSEAVTGLALHGPKLTEDADTLWGSAEWLADHRANPMRPKARFGYGVAQVNHYPLKSVDAYLLKRRRGRANHFNEVLGVGYWNRWNIGGEPDLEAEAVGERRRAEMAALLDDPLTAHLHRAALALSREALADLLRDPEVAELRAALVADSAARFGAKAAKGPTGRVRNRRRLLERMPKGSVCAEIGVWNGEFSVEIVDIVKPASLTLIDPWGLLAGGPAEDWNNKKHGDASAMDEMRGHVEALFRAAPEVTVRQGFSSDVLAEFPDDHFDWVYIDGNHQYDFVKADLDLCFVKVKPGGIIAGDDFFWEKDGRKQVREAVLDALRERGLPRRTALSRYGQQFMIEVSEAASAES